MSGMLPPSCCRDQQVPKRYNEQEESNVNIYPSHVKRSESLQATHNLSSQGSPFNPGPCDECPQPQSCSAREELVRLWAWLALPHIIKVMLATSCAWILCLAKWFPQTVALQGREHTVQVTGILFGFKYCLKFNRTVMLLRKNSCLKKSHAKLVWLHRGHPCV